ncbi:uncharacterized protein LOC125040845 [Penaeus chinensis]|uniref:uncharacterized protein LOC125040845 n=1 Tax=Penaeus chinensis TaxID=139456 RepID=UPI001FB7B6B3|nr:uncharacterized protein LOC125040845 [Penaeus chinensis]
MFSKEVLSLIVILEASSFATAFQNDTIFPPIIQGDWFSWEDGRGIDTEIFQNEISGRGKPVDRRMIRRDIYEYVFAHQSGCYICSRFLIRSWNVMERLDSFCITPESRSSAPTASSICGWLDDRTEGYVMFRLDPSPINCRPSVHGLFHFAWQNRFSFTGECNHPGALLRSCQEPGSQFLISNQKFAINYKKCPGIGESFDGRVEFSCLGNWFVGKNHFFAVVNTKESRKEEKYRCFVRNREDDLYLGHSLTPECSVLKTPENSPVRFRLSYAKHEEVSPGCLLPRNMTGKWISTGSGEPEVTVNSTHISESTWRGYSMKTAHYVCLQQRGNRYLTAKLSVEGCQTEYVCWEFVPRHHNIIRYRRSWAVIYSDFQVCDYANFRSGREWKYDTLIADAPDPIPCPFSGRFSFGQRGPSPFEPRILGGVTSSPLDTYRCHRRITEMAVCDEERKWIMIDTDRCVTLNKDGHPVDFNSVSDYRLQCVGYWKENLLSYLVTYDPSDSASRFRCWVYLRIGETKLRLSQSVGAACGLNQTFLSSTYEESAAVALNLTFEERLYDQCPLYYDDGSDPWRPTDIIRTVFRFSSHNPSVHGPQILALILPVMTLLR